MPNIPETVPEKDRALYAAANAARAALKELASTVEEMRKYPTTNGEALANVTLCFRHLEDGSMRLGKVLQALDGGVSVYDRATTVGA